ncbi:hypothetical protein M5689_000381 [Euphorbia peplus]|nr:hypothetical protein M5689_000381 [Euphorbia peplus]
MVLVKAIRQRRQPEVSFVTLLVLGVRVFWGNIGYCTSTLAELWGLYFGLNLAWGKGFCKVVVELDSQIVLRFMTRTIEFHHPYTWLIGRCLNLQDKNWSMERAIISLVSLLQASKMFFQTTVKAPS